MPSSATAFTSRGARARQHKKEKSTFRFSDLVTPGYRVKAGQGNSVNAEEHKLDVFLDLEAKHIPHTTCNNAAARASSQDERLQAELCTKDAILSLFSEACQTLE